MDKENFCLHSPDIMSATEASLRWGYESGYVRQINRKYPTRIPRKEIRIFDNGIIITRKGMEELTGLTEEEATRYVAWHEKDGIIDFIRLKSNINKCKTEISKYVFAATNQKRFDLHFSDSDNGQLNYINVPSQGKYYYAEKTYFEERIKKHSLTVTPDAHF